MAVTSVTQTGNTPNVVSSDQVGFAGLNADTFMKLLITQLQNQDPTEPVSNEELLNQLAMMRNLTANIELGEALKAITVNQQLSTAATFIGKSVSGTNAKEQLVTGIADRAFLRDGQAYVGIGTEEVALKQVQAVRINAAA